MGAWPRTKSWCVLKKKLKNSIFLKFFYSNIFYVVAVWQITLVSKNVFFALKSSVSWLVFFYLLNSFGWTTQNVSVRMENLFFYFYHSSEAAYLMFKIKLMPAFFIQNYFFCYSHIFYFSCMQQYYTLFLWSVVVVVCTVKVFYCILNIF